MIYLISLIVFATVLLVSVGVYFLLLNKSVVTQRLESLFPQGQSAVSAAQSGTWEAKLARIGAKVQLPEKELSRYAKVLVAAGYRKESIYSLLGAKVLLAAVFPVLFFFLILAPHQLLSDRRSWLFLMACAIVGYLLPSYWLYAKKNQRQTRIFHTLPDVLDLITVCVEAGLSMDAALIKVVETPQFRNDPLAQEIKTTTMEVRAGKPRIEALKDMAERTMVDDLKSFISMLAQTERFGTSLSRALRSHADALRVERRQRAEEAAAKTSIKMVFPLVLFIMPALLVVILGPAIVQVTKIFR